MWQVLLITSRFQLSISHIFLAVFFLRILIISFFLHPIFGLIMMGSKNIENYHVGSNEREKKDWKLKTCCLFPSQQQQDRKIKYKDMIAYKQPTYDGVSFSFSLRHDDLPLESYLEPNGVRVKLSLELCLYVSNLEPPLKHSLLKMLMLQT